MTDPLSSDTDGDGLSDQLEDKNRNGAYDFGETNAVLNDTDQDAILDGDEDSNQNGFRDASGRTPP